MIFFLEVLFWVAIVQAWRYRGKATEANVMGASEELVKLYTARKETWNIVALLSFVVQLMLIVL